MSKPLLGVILALVFVGLESLQFVYFGALFQRMSTFQFGFLVFGLMAIGFITLTAITNPQQIRAALANPAPLILVNVGATLTFGCSLLSVQLIEPAVTYTISAGAMPITTYVLYRLGVREGEGMRNRLEGLGNLLLFFGIVSLSIMTVAGYSGFVRGDPINAVFGVALAIVDGVFFTWILVFSQRLSNAGVGAGAVLGLRFPLFVCVCAGLFAAGVDQKEVLPANEVIFSVLIGLALLIPPLYALQHAVSMISTLTISALTALGPLVIFAMQLVEGRVDYSSATLSGLMLYFAGSLCAALGAVRAATKTG